MIEKATDEALLCAPLAMGLDVALGLVTFGANNFLDFLNAYFIELGIMMFERTYLEGVIALVIEYFEENLPKLASYIESWFTQEDDGLGTPGEGQGDGEGAEGAGHGAGSEAGSDSDVYFSEDDSVEL
jgi:hypothetical protein